MTPSSNLVVLFSDALRINLASMVPRANAPSLPRVMDTNVPHYVLTRPSPVDLLPNCSLDLHVSQPFPDSLRGVSRCGRDSP